MIDIMIKNYPALVSEREGGFHPMSFCSSDLTSESFRYNVSSRGRVVKAMD